MIDRSAIRKILTVFSFLSVGFVTGGRMYGGISMIGSPDGSLLHLPADVLENISIRGFPDSGNCTAGICRPVRHPKSGHDIVDKPFFGMVCYRSLGYSDWLDDCADDYAAGHRSHSGLLSCHRYSDCMPWLVFASAEPKDLKVTILKFC